MPRARWKGRKLIFASSASTPHWRIDKSLGETSAWRTMNAPKRRCGEKQEENQYSRFIPDWYEQTKQLKIFLCLRWLLKNTARGNYASQKGEILNREHITYTQWGASSILRYLLVLPYHFLWLFFVLSVDEGNLGLFSRIPAREKHSAMTSRWRDL